MYRSKSVLANEMQKKKKKGVYDSNELSIQAQKAASDTRRKEHAI